MMGVGGHRDFPSILVMVVLEKPYKMDMSNKESSR